MDEALQEPRAAVSALPGARTAAPAAREDEGYQSAPRAEPGQPAPDTGEAFTGGALVSDFITDDRLFQIPPAYHQVVMRQYCEALDRYFNQRTAPGSFVRAVLENDLLQAVRRMNPPSWDGLWWLIELLIECAPSEAWGSPEKVDAWLAPPMTRDEERDDPADEPDPYLPAPGLPGVV